MRIVFAGTPEFAVPSLRVAARHGQVVAVYTQPDRPAGRGRGLAASPVKREALALGLPVLQPMTLREAPVQAQLRALQPDLMVVVAYGLILPRAVLAIPIHGCWNVHASLLPRWRGAAPIQRAIQAGDARTGVCLMRMEAGLDTGPVLLQQATAIGPEETGGQLHDRLAELGAQLLGQSAWTCSRSHCGQAAAGSAGGKPSRWARRSRALTSPAWCGRPSARAASTVASRAACAGRPRPSSWAQPASSRASRGPSFGPGGFCSQPSSAGA